MLLVSRISKNNELRKSAVDSGAVHAEMLQAIADIENQEVRDGSATFLLGYSIGRFWPLYLCLFCCVVLAIAYGQDRALYFVLIVVILGLLLALNGRRHREVAPTRVTSAEVAAVLEKTSSRDRLMQAYGEALLALMNAQLEQSEAREVVSELNLLMDAGVKVESHQNLMRRAVLGIADLHSLQHEYSQAKEKCRLASDPVAKQAWAQTMDAVEKRIQIRGSYNQHSERLDAQLELLVQRLKTFKDLLVRSSISPYVDLHTAISETSASVKDLLADIDANERAVLELIS